MFHRAEVLGALKHYDEAIAQMLANVAARRRLAAAEPDNYEVRRAVPVGLRPLVELYFAAGRIDLGCHTLDDTRALWVKLAADSGLTGYDRSDEMADLARLAKRCA